jgi:hypothetical protein
MANLIPAAAQTCLTGAMGDWFDTFSANSSIIIHKQPLETVVEERPTDSYWGYNERQPNNSSTYTPVNASYPAIIKYGTDQEDDVMRDIDVRNREGKVTIQVEQAAKDYISDGVTEKVTFDDKHWKIVGSPTHKRFLNRTTYIYDVEEVS